MLTKEQTHQFAQEWVAAWNAHDLDQIMSHYAEDVELLSPVAAQLLDQSDGRVIGKANLRAYFQKGLSAFPALHFDLKDVLWGVRSVVLYYANQRGTHTAEYMEISPQGEVSRVVANYSAPIGMEQ
jgi:hypothetical protein